MFRPFAMVEGGAVGTWSLARRDYMMTEPLEADRDGWINLSDTPGMGYALDEGRLLTTRIG